MSTVQIKQLFFEETGLVAKVVSQIGFNHWVIETVSGEVYHIH